MRAAGFAAALVALAALPLFADEYWLGLMTGLVGYATLASAWALFSGRTGYVALATAAFFGVGAYAVAVLGETLPYLLILPVAAAAGAALALAAGLATLRLAGAYVVIFTFGLAELARQLVTWHEVNVAGTLGRYVFLPIETRHIYWQLLVLGCATMGLSAWIGRSRIGLALRVIGDDETVAAHCGVNLARVKMALFALSAVVIALAGAIQSPRWVYIEPSIAFNPTVSFLTVVMALLGGAGRLWGPLVGAVPLFFLFEWSSSRFPDHFSIVLGALFIAVVFVFPNGVLAGLEKLRARAGAGGGA